MPTRTSAEVARAELGRSGLGACPDLCGGGGAGVRAVPAGTGLGEYAVAVGWMSSLSAASGGVGAAEKGRLGKGR